MFTVNSITIFKPSKPVQTGKGENNMAYKYEIVDQYGNHRSYHNTLENAEKRRQKDLAWRCGICGNNKEGWGKCSCGNHNRVCSAEHYSDRIKVLS